MRDYLVGTLSAVGFFLYFYMGYSRSEDIALNCAAIGALIVAFFPMDWPTKCADPGALPEAIFSLHGIGAAVLFLSIAFVCVVKADDTLDLLTDEKLRAKFKRSYVVLGALMVAMPLSVFLVHLCLPKTECSRVVFFIELAGILIFAAYWLVKSREIHFIQHQN